MNKELNSFQNLNSIGPGLKKINTAYLCILFLIGLLFGKERTLFFDGAVRFYELIAFNVNYFNHYRFPTSLNGIIPWIIHQFNSDPVWALWGFTLNYSVTPVLFFFLLRYYFKSEYLVTFFLISISLLNTILFFHPNHDALFGIYYTVLLFAFLIKFNPAETKYYYPVVFLLLLLFSFTHVSQVPAIAALILYLKYFQKKSIPVLPVLLLFVIALSVKIFLFSSSFEQDIMLRVVDLKSRISAMFTSELVKDFLKSLYSVNLATTLTLISILVLLKNQKKLILALLVILFLVFTVLFISFFYGFYPYNFGTEGYMKGAALIISVVFMDYFIQNDFYRSYVKKLSVLALYSLTLIIIILNGVNYKMYYHNLSKMAKEIKRNTIYVSETAKNLDHYYILHRHSALINMIENKRCEYFQYITDSTNWENGEYVKDTTDAKFCFGIKPVFEKPDSEIKTILDKQFDLIFKLTDYKVRFNLTDYKYLSAE